ncbi:metal-binding protein [beta proteobacterium AAP99]|nr:metal-binding protein [beta proteobacterium AAP99]
MKREELTAYLDATLESARFKDYCPNGLQVEGRAKVKRLVTGVTASVALLQAAIAAEADTILVHHGYFWKNEPAPLTGPKAARIRRLMQNDINLYAYHLPLDAHPVMGNNAQLGARLGLIAIQRFGEYDLGFAADLQEPATAAQWVQRIEQHLERPPQLLGSPDRVIRRVGWCTGGAQGYFDAAIAAGCDLFITGEASEPTYHLAQESGVAFIAAGHHATERYGVQAVGEHLAQRFGIEHTFIDIANPV